MFKRYLINFDLNHLKTTYSDVIIVGTGIAGLYTALLIDPQYKVILISKNNLIENNSFLAQGGVAASIDPDDPFEYHFMDTLKAGNFYNNKEAVKILVEEAGKNIDNLIRYGVQFDRDAKGELKLTREGGHSKRRILHSKDATGKEIICSLIKETNNRENIHVIEDTFVIDLLTVEGKCTGVLVKEKSGISAILSKATVLATGGIGQIYQNTTNSAAATGDGIAMAYRAGAEIHDMEFIQFHPTALYDPAAHRKFLISEAMRGEGAILRNSKGEAFMEKYHELKDLAPRDIVSKAIFMEMMKEKKPNVYLDITHKEKDFLQQRFPTIYQHCLSMGIDISKDFIPVCPVQHYIMGGIKTDIWGRTNIKYLYACGETACTGVHGANRLASNSLLEGLVFGNRIAEEINQKIQHASWIHDNFHFHRDSNNIGKLNLEEIREKIKEIMSQYVFPLRNRKQLRIAFDRITLIIQYVNQLNSDAVEVFELVNIATVAYLIVNSALKRKESLGTHILINDLEGNAID